MVQAAARGVVDFSKADLCDRHWWTRLWWLLDRLEVDNLLRVRELQHAHNCALLDYNLDNKTFDLHWDQAVKALNGVWDLLFPWTQSDARGSPEDRLRQAWVDKWGDPDSPETLMAIQRTTEAMAEMRKRAAAKSKSTGRPRRRSIVPPRHGQGRGK
jgi:hypothetical protein